MNLRGVSASYTIVDEMDSCMPPKRINTFVRNHKLYDEGKPLHYADPIMYSFAELEEMVDWCYATFGECGYRISSMETVWSYQAEPDYIFWFGEEKHLVLFILRWS